MWFVLDPAALSDSVFNHHRQVKVENGDSVPSFRSAWFNRVLSLKKNTPILFEKKKIFRIVNM